jgi:hypothetical protein
VFIFGTILAMIGQVVKTFYGQNLLCDAMIVATGIAAQFALAYGLEWVAQASLDRRPDQAARYRRSCRPNSLFFSATEPGPDKGNVLLAEQMSGVDGFPGNGSRRGVSASSQAFRHKDHRSGLHCRQQPEPGAPTGRSSGRA